MAAKTAAQNRVDGYQNSGDRPAGDRWVTMSNALTRAGHGLTLAEKRIVALAISKLDSRKPLRADQLPVTRLTAAEYSETFGVDIDTAYDQLQAAAKHLYQRSITFFEPDYKRDGKKITDKGMTRTMRWVGQVHYQHGEGWVDLYWWQPLLSHLIGIKKQFTSYQLKQTTALRSAYSWRLLELLQRFDQSNSSGWAEYTIEDFAASMDAPPSIAISFGQIKRRILKPALEELAKKDGWDIKYTEIKGGRKVKGLRFEFQRNPQGNLFNSA
jgi:plasmid replication initiation protein